MKKLWIALLAFTLSLCAACGPAAGQRKNPPPKEQPRLTVSSGPEETALGKEDIPALALMLEIFMDIKGNGSAAMNGDLEDFLKNTPEYNTEFDITELSPAVQQEKQGGEAPAYS